MAKNIFSLEKAVENISLKQILLFAGLLRLFTAYFNPGFFAFDDYQSLIRIVIPAQEIQGFSQIIAESELRSPLVRFLPYAVANIVYFFGGSDPLWQIRGIYLFMGLFSLFGVYWAHQIFASQNRSFEAKVAALVIGTQFLMPYLSTRLMFETFPLTLMMGVVCYSQKYFYRGAIFQLFLALFLLFFTCIARPVLGVTALALFLMPIFKKDLKGFFSLSAVALILFLILGWVEFLMRGQFHASLRYYFDYNINHHGEYGSRPFYYFFPVALFYTGAVFFLWKLNKVEWKDYRFLWVALLYFSVFFVSHCLIVYKEERFFFPILGVSLLLLIPLVVASLDSPKFLKTFFALNLLLVFGIGFYPAQWNIVGMVRALKQHVLPNQKVYRYADSADVFPAAYASHQLPNPILLTEINREVLSEFEDCRAVLLIRDDLLVGLTEFLTEMKAVESFHPGPLERLVIRANPSKNMRRNTLHIATHQNCI